MRLENTRKSNFGYCFVVFASRAIEQSNVRLIVSELRFNLVLRLMLTDFRSVFKVSKKFSSFFFSDSLYGCYFMAVAIVID